MPSPSATSTVAVHRARTASPTRLEEALAEIAVEAPRGADRVGGQPLAVAQDQEQGEQGDERRTRSATRSRRPWSGSRPPTERHRSAEHRRGARGIGEMACHQAASAAPQRHLAEPARRRHAALLGVAEPLHRRVAVARRLDDDHRDRQHQHQPGRQGEAERRQDAAAAFARAGDRAGRAARARPRASPPRPARAGSCARSTARRGEDRHQHAHLVEMRLRSLRASPRRLRNRRLDHRASPDGPGFRGWTLMPCRGREVQPASPGRRQSASNVRGPSWPSTKRQDMRTILPAALLLLCSAATAHRRPSPFRCAGRWHPPPCRPAA